MTSINPGSSDCLPVYYPNATNKQVIYKGGRDFIPQYLNAYYATPTYAALDVRGNNSTYLQHINAFGQVTCHVSKSNHSGTYGPGYEHVTVDGLEYVIRIGAEVTVPANVFTVINMTSNLIATIP